MKTPFLILVVLSFLLLQCSTSSNTEKSTSQGGTSPIYYTTMNTLTVNVYYESNAVPFTGNIASGSLAGTPFWDILKKNLEALFQGREKAVTVEVPKTLGEMSSIPSQGKSSWTATDLENLAKGYMSQNTSTRAYFTILFLRGYFSSEGTTQPTVVGVSVTGTPIIAVFKDVVETTGANPSGPIPKFVEQSTIVHEMGHALGLVNNGVPMTSSHQDSEHGAHCSNPNCVMYYLNEGKSDLVAFAQQISASGSVIMFKDDCLKDTQTYKP